MADVDACRLFVRVVVCCSTANTKERRCHVFADDNLVVGRQLFLCSLSIVCTVANVSVGLYMCLLWSQMDV